MHVAERVTASYDEAFCAELEAFHSAVSGRCALPTDAADARADVALLQDVFAAAGVAGLGGEAGERARRTP